MDMQLGASMKNTSSVGEGRQPLAEQVFQHIATRIVSGEFAPGHRIRDLEVAEELHVSRTPVREALQRLERLGLVVMYPSRYTEVTAVTDETVAQTLEFAGYQAGIAARLGATRSSTAEREHTAALVDLMIAAEGGAALAHARWQLFDYLSERSANAPLRSIMVDTGMTVARNLREWEMPEADAERILDVYRDFREAVLRGDGDAAETLARAMHLV
jgi:DNA-binding GntR family transcriptional regulator